MGFFYENGRGVNQSAGAARRWYRTAARLGDLDAKRALNRLAGKDDPAPFAIYSRTLPGKGAAGRGGGCDTMARLVEARAAH